ncbi:hypothetical protein [Arenimonas sp.]|uniref:hypothetical protein n=1 Tax=Arenimonas sp. TaxID=1872635 RepID=UPI0035B4AFC0
MLGALAVLADMAGNKRKGTPPASAGAQSLLRLLDANLRGKERTELFAVVAERVRTQLLTPDEAALISDWFQRMAQGEDPQKVLVGETRGRPRGSNSNGYIKGRDVSLPDHVDLCWMMRRAIAKTGNEDAIFALVARHFDKTPSYLRKLYREILPTLAADPELAE